MHIVVPIKQVHDPNTLPSFMSVDSNGKSLKLLPGTSIVLNSYDANAVEEAVRLKEKLGGRVTVISVGDKSCIGQIRRAIAMGADGGVHVEGPTGIDCDAHVVGSLLASTVQKVGGADLVICGRQASDTDGGQVPFILAHALGICAISPVIAVQSAPEDAVVVDRISQGGTQRLRARLPVILGVSNEVNKPRVPGLKAVMISRKAEIPSWGIADLGIEQPQERLCLEHLAVALRPKLDTEMISAATPGETGRILADRLKNEGYF